MVYLAPGTYRVSETITVPSGVTLRGSGRENCALEGVGYNPEEDRVSWWSAWTVNAPPTAVIRLADRTGLESLAVRGACSKGLGGVGMVEAIAPDIALHPYSAALYMGPVTRRVGLYDNEIYGSAQLGLDGPNYRTDVVANKFHGGAVSMHSIDCLIDGNFFVDAPARLVVLPYRHTYLRFNEMQMYSRGAWSNERRQRETQEPTTSY